MPVWFSDLFLYCFIRFCFDSYRCSRDLKTLAEIWTSVPVFQKIKYRTLVFSALHSISDFKFHFFSFSAPFVSPCGFAIVQARSFASFSRISRILFMSSRTQLITFQRKKSLKIEIMVENYFLFFYQKIIPLLLLYQVPITRILAIFWAFIPPLNWSDWFWCFFENETARTWLWLKFLKKGFLRLDSFAAGTIDGTSFRFSASKTYHKSAFENH